MPSARRSFVLLCVATYCHFLAMGIFLAVLALYITGPLGGSHTAVGLTVGSFSLSAVVLRPAVGRGVDRRGRRPFLVGGPVLLALSSAGLFFAHTIPAVFALRLLQGVAGACYYTAGATVATDMAPPDRRADYIARFSLFLYGGFATGPALGEYLVNHGGFRAAWAVAGGAAAAAALVGRLVPETLRAWAPVGAVDAVGAVGAAGVAAAGSVAADEAASAGDGAAGRRSTDSSSTQARRPWAGAGVGVGTGAPVGLPAGAPARPRRMHRFLHPAAYGPGFVVLTAAVGYVAISTFSPLYARHIGMGSSGPLYVVFALTVLAVRLFAGRLADHYGRAAVGLPALLSGSAAFALLAAQPPPLLAYIGVGAFGASFALLFPALMALTVDGVDEPERGAALGSFTAFFDLGASGGSYALGALADWAGFGVAFSLPAVLCLVGFCVLWRISGRGRRRGPGPGLRGGGGEGRRARVAAVDEAPFPDPAGA